MAGYTRAMLARARLTADAPPLPADTQPVRTTSALNIDPWTDADWVASMRAREAFDLIEDPDVRRWSLVVTASDGHSRRFYLLGSYAEVAARAETLFPRRNIRSLVIEPAPALRVLGEVIDPALNVIPEDNTNAKLPKMVPDSVDAPARSSRG